jgi:endonuclease/exonuclease/phosphatase (EEP) superfamily protein YafD
MMIMMMLVIMIMVMMVTTLIMISCLVTTLMMAVLIMLTTLIMMSIMVHDADCIQVILPNHVASSSAASVHVAGGPAAAHPHNSTQKFWNAFDLIYRTGQLNSVICFNLRAKMLRKHKSANKGLNKSARL